MEFSSLIEQLIPDVDPVTIATELKKYGSISESNYAYIICLFSQGRDRQCIWRSLLGLMGQTFNIKTFLKILEDTGYASIAINLLLRNLLLQRCHAGVKRLESTSRQSQILFVNLKINTHNNIFTDPREYLRTLSIRCKIKFENETVASLKTHRADKYAAVLCAEIDSHTMLYKKEFPRHGLFDELKRVASFTSDSHVTNVAYNSRKSIAYAIAEDQEQADDYMKAARVSSYNIEQCVEMDNMLYIHVFNLICEYEKCPTEDLRRQILDVAEMGLQCLQYDDDTISAFWKPMFFLRIIYCYLGLSNKGDPILTAVVFKPYIEKSKKLLGAIDRFWDKMQTRRKMFYYAARARINELEGNTDSAIVYLEQAITIGIAGKFGELPYISAYCTTLKHRNRNASPEPYPLTMSTRNIEHSVDENMLTSVRQRASLDSSPTDNMMLNQDLPAVDVNSLLSESQMPSDISAMGRPVCTPEQIAVDEFNFSSEHTPWFDSSPSRGMLAVNSRSPGISTEVGFDSSPQGMLVLNQPSLNNVSPVTSQSYAMEHVIVNQDDMCFEESSLSSGVPTSFVSSPEEMLILNQNVLHDADETDLKLLM